jgi:hypothetical protein
VVLPIAILAVTAIMNTRAIANHTTLFVRSMLLYSISSDGTSQKQLNTAKKKNEDEFETLGKKSKQP